MRRLALFALIIAAVLIPGGVRGQARPARTDSVTKTKVTIVDGAKVVVRNVDVRGFRAFRAFRELRDLRAGRQLREARAIPVVRHTPLRSVGMAIAWLLIVTLVGFALMAFGADKLEIVIHTMQRGVGKSLLTGIVGQLAIVPGAIAVAALLAVTLVGIVLIPLGLMAFIFAFAGVAMFGFIAAATMTGAAIGGKSRDETPHGRMLRAFLTGSAVYMSLWLVTAALSGVPLLGAMLESFSAAVTFIAVTTGFGAVLLSYWRGEFKTPTTLPSA